MDFRFPLSLFWMVGQATVNRVKIYFIFFLNGRETHTKSYINLLLLRVIEILLHQQNHFHDWLLLDLLFLGFGFAIWFVFICLSLSRLLLLWIDTAIGADLCSTHTDRCVNSRCVSYKCSIFQAISTWICQMRFNSQIYQLIFVIRNMLLMEFHLGLMLKVFQVCCVVFFLPRKFSHILVSISISLKLTSSNGHILFALNLNDEF